LIDLLHAAYIEVIDIYSRTASFLPYSHHVVNQNPLWVFSWAFPCSVPFRPQKTNDRPESRSPANMDNKVAAEKVGSLLTAIIAETKTVRWTPDGVGVGL
jgi:hypothetical protein